jgi:hypothetical protein
MTNLTLRQLYFVAMSVLATNFHTLAEKHICLRLNKTACFKEQ